MPNEGRDDWMDAVIYLASTCGTRAREASDWLVQRESTIYFDKLWLSEIGIKY